MIISFLNSFSKKEKSNILILQILLIFTSFIEIFSVASIYPLISVITGNNSDSIFISLFETIMTFLYLEFNEINIIFFTLFCLVSSNLANIILYKYSTTFAFEIGANITNKLLIKYLTQNLNFFNNKNSSLITKNVIQETDRFTSNILLPLLNINTKLFFILFILIFYLIIDIKSTFLLIIAFIISYGLIYWLKFKKLKDNSNAISKNLGFQYSLIKEILSGIREIIIGSYQKPFSKNFSKYSLRLAKAKSSNQIIAQVPRYLLEIFAFSLILFIIFYQFFFLNFNSKNFNELLPLFSLYIFTGYRILPAFQIIFNSLSSIIGNIDSLKIIKEVNYKDDDSLKKNANTFTSNEIVVKNLNFKYGNKSIFKKFSINLEENSKIFISGNSGSGKSTLIDIITGLTEIDDNTIEIGKLEINKNKALIRNNICLVPQNSIFIDDSIASNIDILGYFDSKFNETEINNALIKSCMHRKVNSFKNGIYEKIGGNSGNLLSKGEMQRLAITRCFFENKRIIVLDETTSNIDSATELEIIKNLINLKNSTVLFISHRTENKKFFEKHLEIK